jgi:hypothetical protein
MNSWTHIASNEAQSSPLHEQQRLHARRLLLAVAIIIILAALLLPALSMGQGQTRNAARHSTSGNQTLTQIWTLPYQRCS